MYKNEELVKQAALAGLIARLAKSAPRLTNINKMSKGIAPKATKLYKGFITRKAPEGVRRVPLSKFSPGAPTESLFNPKDIAKRTIGAMSDMAAPWKGKGSLLSKSKKALSDMGNQIKYKPGEMFMQGGKAYQNVHKRTAFGQLMNATQFSLPGVAATSYAFNTKDKGVKRVGKALGQGIAWSPIGLPIATTAMFGQMGYQLGKNILKPKSKSTSPFMNDLKKNKIG